jgi:hypothetical protein
MTRGPGRVMQGITDALAEHGALGYEALCVLIFGDAFTIPDRNSMSRSIRLLEKKGEVKIFWDRLVQCVRRADFDYVRDPSWQAADWAIRVNRRSTTSDAIVGRSYANGSSSPQTTTLPSTALGDNRDDHEFANWIDAWRWVHQHQFAPEVQSVLHAWRQRNTGRAIPPEAYPGIAQEARSWSNGS